MVVILSRQVPCLTLLVISSGRSAVINDVIGFSLLSYVPFVKAWIVREISWIVNVTWNISWGIQIFRGCLYVSVDWKISEYCGYVDIKSDSWIYDRSVDNFWLCFCKTRILFLDRTKL
jgi:hypothetical protein